MSDGVKPGWIESSFDLEGRRIGITVKRIPRDEAERLAATIAWFAHALTTPGHRDGASTWPALLQAVFKHDITMSMDPAVAEELKEPGFADVLCTAALREFIRLNEMSESIDRHLTVWPTCTRAERRVH